MLVFGLRLIRYSLLPETFSESKIHQNAFAAGVSLQSPDPTVRAYEAPQTFYLVGWGNPTFVPVVLAIVLGKSIYFRTSILLASVFIVFINNYLDSFLLQFCYYGIYLLSYTSSCTVMQITDVKIQLQKSKGLNFGQYSAKHARRNTQNDCHQWLSDSSRVHQIRFRRAPPRTPLGELTTLPQTPSRLRTPSPFPIPSMPSASRSKGDSLPAQVVQNLPHLLQVF